MRYAFAMFITIASLFWSGTGNAYENWGSHYDVTGPIGYSRDAYMKLPLAFFTPDALWCKAYFAKGKWRVDRYSYGGEGSRLKSQLLDREADENDNGDQSCGRAPKGAPVRVLGVLDPDYPWVIFVGPANYMGSYGGAAITARKYLRNINKAPSGQSGKRCQHPGQGC